MNEKTTTLIVSDLHMGAADRNDDHVYDQNQFRAFIEEQMATPAGAGGDIELIINGDFLELVQVEPDAYAPGRSKLWCSEAESRQKLDAVIRGHQDVFAALKAFGALGNRVTIAAGNHDVDLYWDDVQDRIRSVAGDVQFELRKVWYERYGGRLAISHGHMFDPANLFQNWENPIVTETDGTPRLEMCPGTLFVIKFVNWLEGSYPFADNLKPVTALARLLWKEQRAGLVTVAWMLSRFVARYPKAALGSSTSAAVAPSQVGQQIVQRIALDDKFAEEIADLYREARDPAATSAAVRAWLTTPDAVADLLSDVVLHVAPERWLAVLDQIKTTTLGIGGTGKTLAIYQAGKTPEKELLRDIARRELTKGNRQVVAIGHTHQPDELRTDDGVYFNTGSWTRYVELNQANSLTLNDLRREEDFPYMLNYVSVAEGSAGELEAKMICYRKEAGKAGTDDKAEAARKSV